ncbi:bifunctional hydroxymethylpyrimidine kinase/phosphomethylpyrimidine kinase [Acanthopleuribacter pedis]|uniref:Thiamine-phosphate synthase n=1 Tax=Acanthopleuribacter pedis TaxID=442870 RepID=A0A8J7Q2H9_9BACT|nr:bifunctional hydroxymethylpyrimidine kinase/phosphomethylpyrimidine kinase [Acanthopleuribacter pedis]MBO1317052.1 bifunctional hydroxymethylpyrimidine kinase/phosphomethylpyrimidine kinase [Acanthopleuribacter pedis]
MSQHPAEGGTSKKQPHPICWTIAGSDSGGGAGIQADIKTFNALGTHGCSVITALTAQNTAGVSAISVTDPDMIDAQLRALKNDLMPRAVKIGMLADRNTILAVHRHLGDLDVPVVIDPVMVATSGDVLLQSDAIQSLRELLIPRATVLTPNLPEAETLLGRTLKNTEDIESAGRDLLALGSQSVWIKGGHGSGATAQDYWTDGTQSLWLTSERHPQGNNHGSGCTLSSALAAALALGYEIRDALVIAKAFVGQSIRLAQPLGAGSAPVHQGGWPEFEGDLPWLTATAEEGNNRLRFPDCGPDRLGFYPIVDSCAWLERLLPLGVKTCQLRVKALRGQALVHEIRRAVQIARQSSCRLFINDYWQIAIDEGAYGVHLGQEDLQTADLAAIAQAGLRLGVSTHCYWEVARALALRPSYMAVGPIFTTQTKDMRFAPQGIEALRRWRRSLSYPLVAIGGIKKHHIATLLSAGADSLAVITAVTEAEDPEAETRHWLQRVH